MQRNDITRAMSIPAGTFEYTEPEWVDVGSISDEAALRQAVATAIASHTFEQVCEDEWDCHTVEKVQPTRFHLDGTIQISGGEIEIPRNEIFMFTGGGINAQDKSRIFWNVGDLYLKDITLSHGKAADGGAIYSERSLYILPGTIFEDNESLASGGGVFFLNTAMSGIRLLIDGAIFRRNHAQQSGGGLFVWSGINQSVALRGSTFAGNTAWGISAVDNGGAGLMLKTGDGVAYLQDCDITQNTADYGNGGGLLLSGNAAIINTSNAKGIISNNTSKGEFGGGVSVSSGASLSMRNCAITGNTATTGGGIAILGAAELAQANAKQNKAIGSDAFGIRYQGLGGGVFIANTGTLALRSCDISGNTAADGGGISSLGHATIVGGDIDDNHAIGGSWSKAESDGNGGGIHQAADGSTVDLAGSVNINGNTAKANGGGIYSLSGLTIDSAAIISVNGNQAQEGDGGAIYTEPVPNLGLVIPAGVSFSDNIASRNQDYETSATSFAAAETVFATQFSGGFAYAYNNYDIRAPFDPPDPAPIQPVPPPIQSEDDIHARIQMCGCPWNEGMFTAVLAEMDGSVIAQRRNSAENWFAFDIPASANTPGLHRYIMKLNSAELDYVKISPRTIYVNVAIDMDRNARVSYPYGRPIFLNCCR